MLISFIQNVENQTIIQIVEGFNYLLAQLNPNIPQFHKELIFGTNSSLKIFSWNNLEQKLMKLWLHELFCAACSMMAMMKMIEMMMLAYFIISTVIKFGWCNLSVFLVFCYNVHNTIKSSIITSFSAKTPITHHPSHTHEHDDLRKIVFVHWTLNTERSVNLVHSSKSCDICVAFSTSIQR